ncbi:hypothetical protein B0H16DRAFT_310448 [Mycena metata]|uniref:Uncharacterized protein n=1 Tax=Mycena metata TaxID=1033252 RepID=A0AAD7NN86_9AGAR|nr:hypothetical protein B0H16DRAFT_310448 [Mycena metata]
MDPSPQFRHLPSLPDPIIIPYEHSAYAGFKNRLWCTWYLKQTLKGTVDRSWAQEWWWEDEDEQYLEGFALSRSTATQLRGMMTAWEWADACSAFEAHRSQSTTFVNPLTHLTCQSRLRFIVWLNLTTTSKIHDSIGAWGRFLSLPYRKEFCPHCGILGFLKTWLETVREVYPLEDLQLIMWEYQCGCFAEALRSLPLGVQAPRVNLAKTSSILQAFYRLVVPTWPVALWMAFRASNDIDVPIFLDILQDPVHQDLVFNHEDDDFAHWENWADYAVEIDLRTWLQIRNTVCKRARRAFPYDVRVTAACLIFSPSPESVFSQPVLEKLGISDYPFDIISKDYKPNSDHAQFASKEFWTSLENWIRTRQLDFCHAVWQTSNLGVLERLSVISNTLASWAPQKDLLFYVYCLTARNIQLVCKR